MSYYNLFSETTRTNVEKKRLHTKVFSENGILDTWTRFYDGKDLLRIAINFETIVDSLTAFSIISQFDFNFPDFDFSNFEFEIKLPSIEDILRGKYIELEKIDFHESFRKYMREVERTEIPETTIDRSTLVNYTIEDPYKEAFQEYIYPIAKYGVTRYDESLYGPSINVKKITQDSKKTWYDAKYETASEKMMDYKEFVDDIVKRRRIIKKAVEDAIFVDTWILDFSKFSEVEGEDNVIEVDGVGKVKMKYIDEVVTRMGERREDYVLKLDYSRLPSEETRKQNIIKHRLYEYINWRARRTYDRFLSPVSKSILSKTPTERRTFYKHRSIEWYGETRSIMKFIREMVYRYLRNYDIDAFTRRHYVSACLEYVFSVLDTGRTDKKFKTEMSDEDIKKYILDKYETQGLNRQILENLLEVADTWRPALRKLAEKQLIPI